MSKEALFDKLYDKQINGVYPELKKRFLDTMVEPTKSTYGYILGRAYKYENMFEKDICEFSWNQLDMLIRTYPNKSMQSVVANISCLNMYINFCISEGFVPDRINYLSGIRGEEDCEKYIDQRAMEKKIIAKERLKEIQGELVNKRDIAILELLFIGANTEEVANLKKYDCNFKENSLKLTKDSGETRLLKNLSDETMNIIKDAIIQKSIMDNNGSEINIKTLLPIRNVRNSLTLNETDYVIRSTSKRRSIDKVTKTFITNLVAKIKFYVDEVYLTPTNMWLSGLVHQAKEIQNEKHKLGKDDYLILCERFGIENTDPYSWNNIKRKIKPHLKQD